MTFGGMVLYLVGGWLILCWMVGWFLFKRTDRVWPSALAVFALLWLPLWDLVPGLAAYNRTIRELGGVRVNKTVVAPGYLNAALKDSDVFTHLQYSEYEYMEVERTGQTGLLKAMESGAGFYEYRLAPRADPRCTAFDALKNAETLRRRYFPDSCVISVRRDQPISRFSYESSRGWESLLDGPQTVPIEVSWQRVRDRYSDEIIAEAYRVRFVSWLGRHLGAPVWISDRAESGKRISIDPTKIIAARDKDNKVNARDE